MDKDLLRLECQNCGASLMVAKDAEMFVCAWCHSSYAMRIEAGTISVRRLHKRIEDISQSIGEDALAAEELEDAENEIEEKRYLRGCLVLPLIMLAIFFPFFFLSKDIGEGIGIVWMLVGVGALSWVLNRWLARKKKAEVTRRLARRRLISQMKGNRGA